jgi:hypothetical protein
VLILALLTTESSYKSEIERPAATVPDTAQFWFGASNPWRICTFAIDHDIHIYSLGASAQSSSMRPNDAEVLEVLAKHKLPGSLEVTPAGFAFYNPDRAKYKTQSEPNDGA